jgi:hypothetical protein
VTPEQASPLAAQVWLMLGEAFTTQDTAAGGGIALALLDAALAPLVHVDDIVRDEPNSPGWSRELDPSTTTRPRWAAQFTGDTPPPGLTETQVRQRLTDRPHQRRGRAASIAAAARPLLTGTRSVIVYERDGSAYRLRVRTYAEETPDVAAVTAALEAAKPGGLLLTHEVVGLTSFAALEAEPAQSFADLEAEPAQSFAALEA